MALDKSELRKASAEGAGSNAGPFLPRAAWPWRQMRYLGKIPEYAFAFDPTVTRNRGVDPAIYQRQTGRYRHKYNNTNVLICINMIHSEIMDI